MKINVGLNFMTIPILTLLFLVASVPVDALPDESIDNDDVILLSEAGLEAETIVAKIQTSPTNFDTSVEALVLLKEAGVSDAVIAAMLSASGQGGGQPDRNEVDGPDVLESHSDAALSTEGEKSGVRESERADVLERPDDSVNVVLFLDYRSPMAARCDFLANDQLITSVDVRPARERRKVPVLDTMTLPPGKHLVEVRCFEFTRTLTRTRGGGQYKNEWYATKPAHITREFLPDRSYKLVLLQKMLAGGPVLRVEAGDSR